MKIKLLYLFSITFSFLLCANTLYSQNTPNIRMQHIDYKDGLLGRRATSVCQDSDGFMWIATVDGLNRYDGFSFKHFNKSNSELNYRELQTRSLFEDSEGYLWLFYFDGVEFLHHQTYEVLTFEERFGEVDFKQEDIDKIKQNKDGKILFQLKTTKYYLYEGKDQPLKHLSFFDNLSAFLFDNNGIWHAHPKGMTLYDFEGQKKRTHTNKEFWPSPFQEGEDDKVYFGTYNRAIQRQYFHVYDNGKHQELSSMELSYDKGKWRFEYDVEHEFILSYALFDLLNPLRIVDVRTNQVHYVPIEGERVFLNIDKNGVIWLAHQDGITLVEFKRNPFEFYKDVGNARGIWANRDKVVVASSHMTDLKYDIHQYEPTPFGGNGDIYSITNHKKELWAGSAGRYTQYAPNSMDVLKVIPFPWEISGNIWSSLKDDNGNFWFSHEKFNDKKFILFYNPTENDSVKIFNQYNGFEAAKNALILQFLEDGNTIWACSNKGLIRIDKQKGVVGHYWKEAEKGSQLPFSDVQWLYKDKENTYWAATNHDGLVRFTLDSKSQVQSVKQYSTDYDFSSDVIYSVFEDDFNRLWMSTLNGLTYFNKVTGEVRVMNDTYGELSMTEFNRTSGFQAIDGRIYFGGVNGAVGFLPSDIDTAQYSKQLLLSSANFFVGAKETRIDQTLAVLTKQKIVVQPSVRYLKVEVALADYMDTQDAKYFYKIEGLHDAFKPMDENSIQLSNLPYGSYKIHFKAQSKDKRFSSSEIVLPFKVIRPFYLRWWFILLVLGVIVWLIWLLFNWRVAQLKKRQAELEAIVEQRTEQIRKDKAIIEQQAEELKELDKLKDRFFANISHELRTPLTLILGPLSNVLNDKKLSNKNFTTLSVVKRHAKYLLKRINEIMELNRLEVNKGQVNLEPVRFYDFCKITISNFESIAPQKNITFTFDYQMKKDSQIMLDKDKFEHIIYNYVSNAFKYTPKNGAVKVTVKEVNNRLHLSVADNGLGIPAEAIPNLFKRFFQAKNAKKASSSGIGLALCREIAELQGGRVWAESEVGKGSTFFFEIPYTEHLGVIEPNQNIEDNGMSSANLSDDYTVKVPETVPQSEEKASSLKHTILLAEDNSELRNYIETLLSDKYEVIATGNGKEALDWLTEEENRPPSAVRRLPSLILSDIMMPEMDGLELLDHLKKDEKYRHIPTVMLTARQSMEAKLTALQLGVDDYITKPFSEPELLFRIKNILANQNERLSFIEKENQNLKGEMRITLSESDQEWLKELEAIVNNNLTDTKFSAISCAEEMYMSKRQLQRRVKKCTGLKFTHYIRLARLRQARQLLESGSVSTIAETAHLSGFETPAYFAKLYYQEFGKKPIEYLQDKKLIE